MFRNVVNDEKYKKYMRSAAWKAKRLATLARAGGICEFTTDTSDYEHMIHCDEKAVYCRHKNYDRVYEELPEDLWMLCPLHHLVVDILYRECKLCGGNIFAGASEAEDLVKNYQESGEKFSMDGLRDQVPSYCWGCDDKLNGSD